MSEIFTTFNSLFKISFGIAIWCFFTGSNNDQPPFLMLLFFILIGLITAFTIKILSFDSQCRVFPEHSELSRLGNVVVLTFLSSVLVATSFLTSDVISIGHTGVGYATYIQEAFYPADLPDKMLVDIMISIPIISAAVMWIIGLLKH